jgi:hypothetical protein
MKKTLIMVFAVLMIMAVQGVAGTLTIDRLPGTYSGNGGEFNITIDITFTKADGTSVTLDEYEFQSFCIEKDEYVTIPGTYNVTVNANEQAIGGGVNTNSGDTLSVGAAYLYSLFARGVLQYYNYADGPNNVTSAGNLQNALWMLEEEISLDTSNIYINYLLKHGFTESSMVANASYGQYGVYVLNLGTSNQDQLIYVPDGGLTVMLLGLGIGGLTLISRKLSL